MVRITSKKFISLLVLICIFFGYALQVYAATLTISPTNGEYEVGDTVTTRVLLTTPSQSANAVSVDLKFPQSKMRVLSITKDDSIIPYWVSEPTFSNGTGDVHFEGIVPNPGFQSSNGRLVTISFQVLDEGTAAVDIIRGSVLANDGNGTEIFSGSVNASYVFVPPVIATTTPTTTPPLPPDDEPPAPPDDPKNPDDGVPPSGQPGGSGTTTLVGAEGAGRTFENTVDVVSEAVQEAFEPVTEFVQSPTGQIVTRTLATFGAVTSFSSLFVSSLSLADLLLIPLRLWALLMAAFGIKKRNRPWGTVYDSVTKQPIDPALVVLHDQSGKVVQNAITDMDGRYGFATLDPGVYTLTANKSHYSFPSEVLAGKTHDELYTDLYFGGEVTVDEENSLIVKNIPLDPKDFDWNEFVKSQQNLVHFYSRREWWWEKITTWMFRAGFAITIFATIVTYAPYNFVTLGLYILLAILRVYKIRSNVYGHVKEKDSGRPLSFAIITIYYDAAAEIKIATRVADKNGRYYCLVPNGRYLAKIERKNADQSYTTVYTSAPFDVTNGIISQTFEV
jgi:hypothetical protein